MAQSEGTGTLLLIGGAALVGFLLLRSSKASAATPAPMSEWAALDPEDAIKNGSYPESARSQLVKMQTAPLAVGGVAVAALRHDDVKSAVVVQVRVVAIDPSINVYQVKIEKVLVNNGMKQPPVGGVFIVSRPMLLVE